MRGCGFRRPPRWYHSGGTSDAALASRLQTTPAPVLFNGGAGVASAPYSDLRHSVGPPAIGIIIEVIDSALSF